MSSSPTRSRCQREWRAAGAAHVGYLADRKRSRDVRAERQRARLLGNAHRLVGDAAPPPVPDDPPAIRASGDAVEEPGDYPFGLNPAGYTSRSMIVICK